MDIHILQTCTLFKNIAKQDIDTLLNDVHAYQKAYKKDTFIYHMQDTNVHLGIVLSGKVAILQRDYLGKENMYSHIDRGDIFAETYALLPDYPLMVDVIAEEDTQILFLDIENVQHSRNQYAHLIRQNLLTLMAQKNIMLSRKIIHISARTIRERLLSYLQDECVKQQSNQIVLPYNQQQLADYLCVDRSALSNAWSKCKKEGLIEVKHGSIVVMFTL